MENGDAKLLERIFPHFAKNVMDEKSFAKLLEMLYWYLLTHIENFRKHTDTIIAFIREYSRVSYLSIGKQWLKSLIIYHHVSTNLIYQVN